MATFSSVSRQHILQALAEYDDRGGDAFLDLYGFAPTPGYELVHEDRGYDVKAVLGVAHRFATGRLATPDAFSSGMANAVAILRKRGFQVTEPAGAVRLAPVKPARAPRAPRAAAPRAARPISSRTTDARDAPPRLCPTCSMTLPSTGVCDYCS
ncbi:hypothetical protein [Cellulomonas cellasea]|uniref:ScoMcrA-like N-terminal head domain-containing protein n=2 Tax=Cellulomonas cellasea TaxID=43670 RepID=A0A0A0B5A9_9CELL|nr:hypothetical protein [Cellulomonas cellasea]KGM02020.1 hypothetical protein Q760_16015 [Cellulomonas cellasea DSM 20118]GEA86644.1 hypothetical protein CCE01nite_05930 [Cellulomonas cellasea]